MMLQIWIPRVHKAARKNSVRFFATAWVLLTLTLAGGVESASAVRLHPVEVGSFGPDGTSATSFDQIDSLAFDQAKKRLYALSANQDNPAELFGFNSSTPGTYSPVAGFEPLITDAMGFFRAQLAVDNSTGPSAGNVYVLRQSGPEKIFGFNPTGATATGWPLEIPILPPAGGKIITDVAVDPLTGNVWAADGAFRSQTRRYTATGGLLSPFPTEPPGWGHRLAFDSNGDLYFEIETAFTGESSIYKYEAPGYTKRTTLVAGGGLHIAVDTSTHDLYVAKAHKIERYSSSGALLEEFATSLPSEITGFAIDHGSGEVYVSTLTKIFRFPGLDLPRPTTGSASEANDTSVKLDGTVSPDGLALTDCRFEYVTASAFDVTGFSDLSSGGSASCLPAAGDIPADSALHDVSATIGGLSIGVSYRYRLVAANANGANPGQTGSFRTGKPLVETTGSPVHSATTARLEGRVDPHGVISTYQFEYGDQGPCDANPCVVTDPHSVGSDDELKFVSQQVKGLKTGTTYHYRVIADNGHPDGPAFGADMTLATRDSDAPLSHGRFPGPPGSDRAWEQVSLPDTSGNPVSSAISISDNGERAFYQVFGGTPGSPTGSLITQSFAERTSSGWRRPNIFPSRDQLAGAVWLSPAGSRDLSDQLMVNINTTTFASMLWRVRPDKPAEKLYEPAVDALRALLVPEEAHRFLAILSGSVDPNHPVDPSATNLYDLTDGAPRLIGFMPDGSVPSCGATVASADANGVVPRDKRTVTPDGSLIFFESCAALYARDLESEETRLIAPSSKFMKWTPGAAFISTGQNLDPDDSNGIDVYRYDLADESFDCITCVTPGGVGDIGTSEVAIAADGSRVYFRSPSSKALLPGASPFGVYRVDVASGDLAYVAPGIRTVSENPSVGNALTPDGSVFVFTSNDTGLNALGGLQNGGTRQYYRYDDRDRSLTCLSCPQDGGDPKSGNQLSLAVTGAGSGANLTPLSADGETFAFTTSNALLPVDQNTAGPGESPDSGTDLYEWRDGRLLMLTDGLITWPDAGPSLQAVAPSGRDVFFVAATQYTQDALDGYRRLYDARIGGGIEFPRPPKPCPLEVCQGTPKGTPEEAAPGTGSFAGAGNLKPRTQKKRKPKRHVKRGPHKKHRAKHERRAQR